MLLQNIFSKKINNIQNILTDRAVVVKRLYMLFKLWYRGVLKPKHSQHHKWYFSIFDLILQSHLQLRIREPIKEGFSYFLPMRVMRYLDMICGCTAATILVYFPPVLIRDQLVWMVRIGHHWTQWTERASWTAPRSWSCCHIPHHQPLMVPNTYQVLSHTPQKACFPALFTILTVKRV